MFLWVIGNALKIIWIINEKINWTEAKYRSLMKSALLFFWASVFLQFFFGESLIDFFQIFCVSLIFKSLQTGSAPIFKKVLVGPVLGKRVRKYCFFCNFGKYLPSFFPGINITWKTPLLSLDYSWINLKWKSILLLIF